MLYTRKGDKGTTRLFDCPNGMRMSKSEIVFEALGTLDELNSSIGYAKALSKKGSTTVSIETKKVSYEAILEKLQQNLFCIQAELAGAKTSLTKEHITFLEQVIYEIETVLPPITSFKIAGGGDTGAYLDITRTIARRAERLVVTVRDKKGNKVSDLSIQFLNRLSSVLYALARFANYQEGYREAGPHYR
ncbi:MAG: cob(I)yrinic acid a,c-diamide adenosyltransferase [Candidatus Taylorbacteria bacterium]